MKLLKEQANRKGSLKLKFRNGKAEYVDLPTVNRTSALTDSEVEEFRQTVQSLLGKPVHKPARKRKSA